MKNLFKLIGVVLVTAFLLVTVSCGEDEIIKKGGSIAVTNGLGGSNIKTNVMVVKGIDYQAAITELSNGGGTEILAGATETFKFDEDGAYTVVASPPIPIPFTETVYLTLGAAKKVTIKSSTASAAP
jgi:hypothetical protein